MGRRGAFLSASVAPFSPGSRPGPCGVGLRPSLDAGCGRRRGAGTGKPRSEAPVQQNQASTVTGDCHTYPTKDRG